MTKTERLISDAFGAACALCDSFGDGGRVLKAARDIAAKQEREHRAMGRRWVGSDIGPHASVRATAEFFALRGFYTSPRCRSFEHRSDFVTAYGAASRVMFRPEGRRAWQAAKRRARAVLDLEYPEMKAATRAA